MILERELKIGDMFDASDIHDEELRLVSVMHDKAGDAWAIVVDADGVPYCVSENAIDDDTQTVILVLPTAPAKINKKGKK